MSDGHFKRELDCLPERNSADSLRDGDAPVHPQGQLELFAAKPTDSIYAGESPSGGGEIRIATHPAMAADPSFNAMPVTPLRIEVPEEIADKNLAGAWSESAEDIPVRVSEFRSTLRRTPNFADACLFAVLLVMGFLVTTGMLGVSLHYHWFGLRNFNDAKDDTRIALVTQLMIYLVGLVGAVPFFQMVWGRGFFDGLHWHGATARRMLKWLLLTAVACNVVAMVGNYVLPFPQHAPIDKMFSTSGDAWMLFCFGVTVAPFFEEMIFRGFLLPAMATAWDWCAEKVTHASPKDLDSNGNPVWSRGAMVFAALVVSAPFALMHSAQVGSAWGPISLLYCVSLILCAVRLMTRSLAASTVVHSAYNFMLFAVMLIQTDGFRHLDKM